MQVVFRSALFLVIAAAIALGPCPAVQAADVAIYEFTGNSPNSTDADAATTAGAWTQTVGSITSDQVRADGSQVEGSFASSITANEYGGFIFNTNGNVRDLSRLSLDYNGENPFGASLGVFASTDGGATGFAAGNQLFTVNLADVAGTSPITTVSSSNFFDLGNIASLQGLNGNAEFRFYLLDNSSLTARVQIIDNVRLSALASTASDPRWNVNASGSYGTASNWAPAAVPGAGANVVFGDVITADRTVTLGSNVSAGRIAFSGNNGAYTIAPAASQTISLTGSGEVRATGTQQHTIAAALSGSVGLTKEGGGDVTLANAANNYTGGTNINGGTLRATSTGAVQGAINVGAGATLVFQGNGAGGGYNGTFANALTGTGTATLSDALTTETVTMNAAKSFGGVYRVAGGTLAVSNAGAFGAGGTNASRTEVAANSGKLAISGNIAVGNEVLALSARGTDDVQLTSSGTNSWAGDISGRSGLGQYNIESTSGTLTLSGRLSGFDVANGVDRTYVFSGAGNTTVTGLITDDAIANDGTRTASVANNLSVVKRGAGTLTISTQTANVADYHRGSTVVEQGTLRVTAAAGDIGELSSRSVMVNAGATLNLTSFGTYNMQAQSSLGLVQTFGGAGTINANTFGYFDDASLSPGDSVGTLTINGALNMTAFGPSPLGALNFELGSATTVGGGVNDLIKVNGALTANTSGGNFAVKVTPSNGSFASGTYRLIEYTGALGGSATGANFIPTVVDAAGAAVGQTRQTFAVSTASAGAVNLIVTGAAQNLTWSGSPNGTWDIATTSNWTNAGAQQFFNLDSVTFGASPSTFNVSIPANVMPASTTFNGGANTYTFTGVGGIVGSGPINVNTGTVVLDNANNNFTGTVTIANGATLQVGAGGANAARLPSGETPYVVNGSLIINELSGGETITGPISGSGSVTVQSSQLTLSGNNSGFTGAIVAAAGTNVNIDNADVGSPLGSAATGTTIGAGATLLANSQSATIAEPVTLNAGALRVGGGTSSKLTWSGPITVGTGGVAEIRQDSGSDTPTSVGLTVAGNISGSAGQNLRLRVDTGSTTVVTGGVQHNGGLIKNSTGRAELRGTNTFTGNTTVEAGTLALVGASDLATSPLVQVQAGATLDTSGRTGGGLTVANTRTLDVAGSVVGNTSAASGSTISINGDGAATITARTVKFTPPLGTLGSNSDVRVRAGSGANANQNDTAALGLGQISATDAFRSLLTFDLSATGITDPNYINNVAVTLTLQAPNGAQVDTPSAPQFELLTIQPYNSDTATFNNTSFATTATPPAQPPAALISTTTGPQFTQYVAGATLGWSQANSGAFVDAVKGKLGSSLVLGARAAVTSPVTTTRSFYFIDSAETTTAGAAPSLAITYTDPTNPVVTGIGSAVFEGDLTLASGSSLKVDLFNTSLFDKLDVNGAAALSGTLAVDVIDLSRLAINDTFTILTANSIVNNLTLGGPDGSLFNLSSSTATSLVLKYVGAVTLPGDFNGNQVVDAADYTVWRDNQGQPEGSLLNGNGTGGTIDIADYNLWKNNFGNVPPPSVAASSAVPEPGAIVLVLLGSMAAVCVRRR